MTASSFSEVFSSALRGDPCHVVWLDDERSPLPVGQWRDTADASDRAVLAHCVGPTIDIGCGPGRMSEHLVREGHRVLAIDLVAEAVSQTRARGVTALLRDVFSPLPDEGCWQTALLADGNIGIGGDPGALLRRLHDLLAPGGRVVADLAPAGIGVSTRWARLSTGGADSRPFRWARVGVEAIGPLAVESGLSLSGIHAVGGRWFAVLERTG